MRQILLSSSGAVVARMPRPAVAPGTVVVRTRYSLISVGTEIAGLVGSASSAPLDDVGRIKHAIRNPSAARELLARAWADPETAKRRVATLVRGRVQRAIAQMPPWLQPGDEVPPTAAATAPEDLTPPTLRWTAAGEATVDADGPRLQVKTDTIAHSYQAMTDPITVPSGCVAELELRGTVGGGTITIGFLDADRASWLGSALVPPGEVEERLVVNPGSNREVTLLVANTDEPEGGVVELSEVSVRWLAPDPTGLPASELDQQGWNVGYSVAGEVIEVGAGIDDLHVGDLVACAGAGMANHADFVRVSRNLVARVPAGVDVRDAATTTVGTIALQGVRRAAPELGDRVCVIGLGLIGQLTAQMVSASGAEVIGYDLAESRAERAASLGAAHTASDEQALRRIVRDRTGDRGVDVTIITASAKTNAVINLAMQLTRRKGRVVIVGDIGLGVERADFYRKEIDLLMSTSYGPGRYDADYELRGQDYPYAYVRWTENRNMSAYMELIERGRVDVAALIDEVVDVDDAHDAYQRLASSDGEKPLGVLLAYGDAAGPPGQRLDDTAVALRGARRPRTGPAGVALVGAGGFAQGMLLPLMKKDKASFALQAIVSSDTTRGGNLGRLEQAPMITTRLEDALASDDVDLVVLATRHNLHAEQVLASLAAGKDVFVEKPLAISWAELDAITEAYTAMDDPPVLTVGFNRRFSPAVQALAEALAGRTSPLVATYRVNAGYVPPDSWLHGVEGGGRNLGEACHFYDVFRALTGAAVASVTATPVTSGASHILPTDNFQATIGFTDGSVCSLVYTAQGPKEGMAKERLEVISGGEAWLLDDYKSLTRVSDGQVLWSAKAADKGHAEEFRLLAAALSGGPLPIPFTEIVEASAVALHVDDLLRSPGVEATS